MSLCGRPPYQKGSAKKKRNVPTVAQKKRWDQLVSIMGCVLNRMGIFHECRGRITIHHCGTGAGGRKDHDKIVPLCSNMHTGPNGIDGRQNLSKRTWQEVYCAESDMLAAVEEYESKPF